MNRAIQTLPYDADAERSLIGSLLLAPDTLGEVAEQIGQQSFYMATAGQAFHAIKSLTASGQGVDGITVLEQLRRTGSADDTTADWLAEAMTTTPHAGHVRYYAEIVADRHARRKLALLSTEIAEKAHDLKTPVGDVVQVAGEALSRVGVAKSATAVEKFPLYDGAALDSLDCRVDYLIHNLLVAGQPCIVAGPKKSLKTGTLIDMAVSLASGTQCLNTFAVHTPRNVLLMTGESGEGTIQETARRIAESKGLDLRDLDRFKVAFNLPRLAEAADLVRLEDLIGTHNLDVLMVDPAYLAFSGLEDAANLFAVGSMLWPLSEIGQRTGATIVIAHHCKKNTNASPYAQPELNDIAWSGFAEWARQWVLLNRREPYDPESGGVHHLWLSVGGSAGHGGAWSLDISEGRRTDIGGRFWSVALGSAREEKESRQDEIHDMKAERRERQRTAQLETDAAKLLGVFKKHPDGETKSNAWALAGLNSTRGGQALSKLLDEELIVATEVQKRSATYDGFKVTEAGPTTPTGSDTTPTI
jgi:hypothetical protein